MSDWLKLVMQMKKKYGCSLTEAMKHAKAKYVKKK